MYDVAIVGGGVVGCSIARELSRYRLNVVLLEKCAEVGFGTTKSNSGIVHPGHQSSPKTLKGRLDAKGNSMFDDLCRDLHFGFRRIGELVVAQSEEELPLLRKMMGNGSEKGVPGLEIWDKERLRREEPNLSPALSGALFAPSAGVINPYEFAYSLIENAIDNGVKVFVDSPVESIEVLDQCLVSHTPQGKIAARFVVNCAGVFSDEVAAMVHAADFSIHPRKGEEYLLDKRLKGVVRRLVFPLPTPTTKGILIIPTLDGTIMVGPTAQDQEDRRDLSTSIEGADQAFHTVRKICPCISERDTIAEFAGLRAVSDTEDFIIGTTRVKGFINAAGIQSPGLTAAPAIAEYVRDILAAEGLSLLPKDDFNPCVAGPARFAALGTEERRRLVAQNPMFAKVVCRCELVTEAEIHEAIDHGARTLDGIKFRTRAGMGRCQGGFCTARCMDILSRRLGKPFHEIQKRGGGSWMVLPMADVDG